MPTSPNLDLLAIYGFLAVVVLAMFVLGLVALSARKGRIRLHVIHDPDTGRTEVGGELSADREDERPVGRADRAARPEPSPPLTPPPSAAPPRRGPRR